jgi:hypothetical protein
MLSVSKDIKWTTHEKRQAQYWTSYKEMCDMVHKNVRRLRIFSWYNEVWCNSMGHKHECQDLPNKKSLVCFMSHL